MNMPESVWMHVDANGILSCHLNAIDASSVYFVPALRAVKAEARIAQLEAALQLIGNELSLHADQGPAGEAFRALLVPTLETKPKHRSYASTFNTGHGHVYVRPDGVKARCGGPGLCGECSRDLALLERDHPSQAKTGAKE